MIESEEQQQPEPDVTEAEETPAGDQHWPEPGESREEDPGEQAEGA